MMRRSARCDAISGRRDNATRLHPVDLARAQFATMTLAHFLRVMVSSPDFGNSLTVDSASSAHYTLVVMTVVALFATPVVLLYQGWTYHIFRHRLAEPEVDAPAQPAGP
jgi:cytochrome bd-type quinol oxidase subunit 2